MFVLEFNENQKAFHIQPVEDRNKYKNNEEWRVVRFGKCEKLHKLHNELTKDNPKTLDEINSIIRVRNLFGEFNG